MKAMVYTEYGPPEVLHLDEMPKPAPQADEILVKVHAATVTAGDCNMRGFTYIPDGFRFMSRLMFGLRKPKKPILGVEFAGEVAAVGSEVTAFKPGDAVFGTDGIRIGAYAEYKTIPATAGVTLKPAKVSYEEAAVIPTGSLTAYTFLRKKGNIQAGQKVLINGASGNVGSAAVQLAKFYGAEVTGVCSTPNVDLVKSLGADHVIDYTQEDFTQNGETYDLIYDAAVGKMSFAQCKDSLTQNGMYLAVAGGLGDIGRALWTSLFGSKQVEAGIASEKKEDLEAIKELVEAGAIKPVIDRRFPLEQAAEAHRYAESGHKQGNVVITVAQ